MTQLPTDRTSANTVAEHVADHNTLATEHNELDGHAAATTTVHGITDSSTLVVTGDSRLSDTRTPTDGSVTNAKVSASAAIAKSKLAALAIVNADVDAAAAIAETKLSLASDAAAGTASRRSLGTSSTQAAAGDHAHSAYANIDGAGTGAVAAAHTGDTATASSTQAIAIGANARATTGAEAIAIGGGVGTTAAPLANAQGAIAIGASDASGVAGARASGTTSVAIGSGDASFVGAAATGAAAVAVGYRSTAAAASVAVGRQAASAGTSAVAVGIAATASAASAVALGDQASAAHANAVALGDSVATTTTNQVNVGTKRLHQGVPNTAPADADLIASQASLWLDESNSVLSFKAKRAAGTVLSGGLSPTTHAHSGTYEPSGTVATHAAAADPHTGYVLESLIDAAGDLIVGTADNAVGRLGMGAALAVLRVNAGATALEFAAPAAAGDMTFARFAFR